MSRRIHTSVIAAAITAALLAGCGGGGGSGSSTTSSTTTVAAKTSQTSSSTAAAAATTSSRTTSSVPANLGSLGTGAVAAYCQSALGAAKGLSSTERSQFTSYCASLAHDTPAQLKSAERTLCDDIIKDTVPASEQSLAKTECAKL